MKDGMNKSKLKWDTVICLQPCKYNKENICHFKNPKRVKGSFKCASFKQQA